jgi:hypothetical protein
MFHAVPTSSWVVVDNVRLGFPALSRQWVAPSSLRPRPGCFYPARLRPTHRRFDLLDALTHQVQTQGPSFMMSLRPSYTNLQLDPDDQSQMVAFSAFCWQHLLDHVSPRWIAEVRQGTIRLHYRTEATYYGESCSVFNQQLNGTVSAFVEKYATLIWPVEDETRAHLADARGVLDMREVYATTSTMTIAHKKEALMRECNVVMSVEDAVAESMIGHRIRTYLMQLLVSDEPIPTRQQMSAMALLMRFLSLPSAPDLFNGKRYHTSASPDRFDSRRASRNTRSESPRARKRRRLCDTATTPTRGPYERSAGRVRLRFTYSGFQRLQRILLCPSRPPAITQRRTRALEEPIHSHSIRTGNGNPRPQQGSSATRNTSAGCEIAAKSSRPLEMLWTTSKMSILLA